MEKVFSQKEMSRLALAKISLGATQMRARLKARGQEASEEKAEQGQRNGGIWGHLGEEVNRYC